MGKHSTYIGNFVVARHGTTARRFICQHFLLIVIVKCPYTEEVVTRALWQSSEHLFSFTMLKFTE
jgi:hypothetical protein